MNKNFSSFLNIRYGGLLLTLAIFVVLIATNWTGFLASDDVTYAHGAYGWIEHFPFVGGHGTIRYPITIPMALSFAFVGNNEFAMVLPSLAYMFLFLFLVWRTINNLSGKIDAFMVLLILVTSPLLVIQSSIASVDIVEMAFLFASIFFYWHCVRHGPDKKYLFAAGAMAGLAFLTRETAIFIVPFYALVFLAGYRFSRAHYFWIVGGFLFIWGLEVLYLWVMTGDPLYRINISLHHDATINRSIDLAGNLIVNPYLDPLLTLLVNQEFMLLYFVAIPAAFWLCFSRTVNEEKQTFCRILAAFGLIWFLCVGAAQKLLPLNPRYFMITTAVACILTGLALSQLMTSKRILALGTVLMILATNYLGIFVENKDHVFGARQLANLARQYDRETIVTDPMTRYRADMLLRWENAQPRVVATHPTPTKLYYYNPAYADAANAKMSASELPYYRPLQGWTVVGRFSPEPGLVIGTVERTGLYKIIPDSIWKKLRYRHPEVVLYRVQ